MTHSENGTGNRDTEQKVIIQAEGVVVGEWTEQAISSTPEACGLVFIIRARARSVRGTQDSAGAYRVRATRSSLWRRYWK